MFEGRQTKFDNFEEERAEKLRNGRREALLTLASKLGADEANAKNGIESMLLMAEELATEFTEESMEKLN